MTTPTDLLMKELRRDGARPLITAYDGDGGRVELSVATTANWVAKTTGYLADELGIEPGDGVAVDPVLHWLTAVALLAAWAVGAEVVLGPAPRADRLDVPLDPMGAAFSRLVAGYPDSYVPAEPGGHEVVAAAPTVPAGARILSALPLDRAGIGYGLLSPLAAGGSLVYASRAANLDSIAAAERVTHTAGVDAPGLPRLD